MFATPVEVAIRTWKKTPMAMMAHFEPSPIPKMSMISGRMATLGMGKMAPTMGCTAALTIGTSPITTPNASPGRAPSTKPMQARERLVST
ncbi:hypothetical protein D9M68_319360 [compost metagenome]